MVVSLTCRLARCMMLTDITEALMTDKPPATSTSRAVGGLRVVALFSGMGLGMAASIAIGAFGGKWLDGRLGTEPWLLVLGFALGTVAGFVHLFRLISQLSSNNSSR